MLRYSTDGKRFFHVAEVGVGGGYQVGIGVDCIIVVQSVAQVCFELCKETSGDKGGRGSIDTWLALYRRLVCPGMGPRVEGG